MRQAIEEGFILDVLKNYTPYKLAFKLAHNGKELDDKEVEGSEALKGIMRWVKLHPYNISTLVAFSGEVNDAQSSPDPFHETGKTMNPNLKGQGIREAFNTDDYQILLVANKFQTGFDQPLLCGIYVDKRLAGIAAVQTLSRLNRGYPGKDTTYVSVNK